MYFEHCPRLSASYVTSSYACLPRASFFPGSAYRYTFDLDSSSFVKRTRRRRVIVVRTRRIGMSSQSTVKPFLFDKPRYIFFLIIFDFFFFFAKTRSIIRHISFHWAGVVRFVRPGLRLRVRLRCSRRIFIKPYTLILLARLFSFIYSFFFLHNSTSNTMLYYVESDIFFQCRPTHHFSLNTH